MAECGSIAQIGGQLLTSAVRNLAPSPFKEVFNLVAPALSAAIRPPSPTIADAAKDAIISGIQSLGSNPGLAIDSVKNLASLGQSSGSKRQSRPPNSSKNRASSSSSKNSATGTHSSNKRASSCSSQSTTRSSNGRGSREPTSASSSKRASSCSIQSTSGGGSRQSSSGSGSSNRKACSCSSQSSSNSRRTCCCAGQSSSGQSSSSSRHSSGSSRSSSCSSRAQVSSRDSISSRHTASKQQSSSENRPRSGGHSSGSSSENRPRSGGSSSSSQTTGSNKASVSSRHGPSKQQSSSENRPKSGQSVPKLEHASKKSSARKPEPSDFAETNINTDGSVQIHSRQPFKFIITVEKSAISWPSTSLHVSSSRNIRIKVESERDMKARISIQNTDSFKIKNDGEEMDSIDLILSPWKSFNLFVVFKPQSLGCHNEQLVFEFADTSKVLRVRLIGYGGNSNIHIKDTIADLQGNRIIMLQQLQSPNQDSSDFKADFRVHNYGYAPGFVLITPHITELATEPLKVLPGKSVIEPNSSALFTITLNLHQREILEILKNENSLRIGSVKLITGNQVDLQRFIHHRAKYMPPEDEQTSYDDALRKLVNAFRNGEPPEVALEEAANYPKTFQAQIVFHEVVIVMERSGTVKLEAPIGIGAANSSVPLQPGTIYRNSSKEATNGQQTDARDYKDQITFRNLDETQNIMDETESTLVARHIDTTVILF